jgi:phosphatidylglycerol:prolipoprotein diacylglycerol transferase
VLADPLSACKVWEGGMSFHGGLLGVLAAALVVVAQHRPAFLRHGGFRRAAGAARAGLRALGNYIGGELWGKSRQAGVGRDLPEIAARSVLLDGRQCVACRRSESGALDAFARHPSQLYQAVLEGLLMFACCGGSPRKPRRAMPCPGCSRCSTACSVSWWNSCASRMNTSAIWRSAG